MKRYSMQNLNPLGWCVHSLASDKLSEQEVLPEVKKVTS